MDQAPSSRAMNADMPITKTASLTQLETYGDVVAARLDVLLKFTISPAACT